MIPPVSQVEIESTAELRAASRSQVYQLCAAAFSFPTHEIFQSLRSGNFSEKLREVTANLPYELSVERAGIKALLLSFADFQTQFIGLFEVGQGGIPPCPLNEGDYAGSRTGEMAELLSFYHYFGLRIGQGQPRELPDHASLELEFMHFLTFKEALSLSERKAAEPFLRAERDFLERHLLDFVSEIAQRLQPLKVPFFSDMIGLTEGFCRRDLAYLSHKADS